MTERIKNMLSILKSGDYKKNRNCEVIDITDQMDGVSDALRKPIAFKHTLENERLNAFNGDRIGFNRTRKYTTVFNYSCGLKRWGRGNSTPNYGKIITSGFDDIKTDIEARLSECNDSQREFYQGALMSITSVLDFADRCREEAKSSGNTELYNALCTIPHKGATSYYEACVFLKFIVFTLRCEENSHLTIGRFDQYMKLFYDNDIAKGVSKDELLELTEELFISLNFDTDLYDGMQLGDNGQSLVLGGYDLEGRDMYNELSEICMKASMELKVIDPKINLRVSSKTPIERLEFATEMTKLGLGFPQYCNDDIVIPGLIDLGYAPEDAADYTVAACWEFIIPNKGFDTPNFLTMNFPLCIETAVNRYLLESNSFDEFLKKVKQVIIDECNRLIVSRGDYSTQTSPYLSVFHEGCLEKGVDVYLYGAIYNNYGCHGAGISTAADSLAAIKKTVFEDKTISKENLLDALKNDYKGYGDLRNKLLSCPKMGNNDDYVDDLAAFIMETFADNFNNKPNRVGGIFRAGTGSAMEYILSAKNVGATPDGRKSGKPFGSSFSPSPEAQLNGPLSVIQSFTKFDLKKIINGGPLTMEVHDTVFRNLDGIKKTAQLVKAFIDLGGHQLQLNSINREVLLDAEEHPENHKNLIVRVWGWSGYFVELDKPYRDHIIARTEHQY